MKTTLLVFFSLLLVVLIVAAIGSLLPRHHSVTRSARFATPPAQLFALISGPQNWRKDIVDSQLYTSPNQQLLVRETNSRGKKIDYALLNVDPPRGLERRIVTEGLGYSGTWIFRLRPDGQGTQLTITEDGDVQNPIFRFVARFILGHTASLDAYLHALATAAGQTIEITSE